MGWRLDTHVRRPAESSSMAAVIDASFRRKEVGQCSKTLTRLSLADASGILHAMCLHVLQFAHMFVEGRLYNRRHLQLHVFERGLNI